MMPTRFRWTPSGMEMHEDGRWCNLAEVDVRPARVVETPGLEIVDTFLDGLDEDAERAERWARIERLCDGWVAQPGSGIAADLVPLARQYLDDMDAERRRFMGEGEGKPAGALTPEAGDVDGVGGRPE